MVRASGSCKFLDLDGYSAVGDMDKIFARFAGKPQSFGYEMRPKYKEDGKLLLIDPYLEQYLE